MAFRLIRTPQKQINNYSPELTDQAQHIFVDLFSNSSNPEKLVTNCFIE